MTPEERLKTFGTVSNYTRLEVIGPWQEIVYKEKIAGDMYWFVSPTSSPTLSQVELCDLTFWENRRQLGVSGLSTGNSDDVRIISTRNTSVLTLFVGRVHYLLR